MTPTFSFFLIFFVFLFSACEKKLPSLSEADDKIYSDYQAELISLEKKHGALRLQRDEIDQKTETLTINPKISEILKKQKQSINQNIIYLEQNINYLKIKSLSRKKYLLDNQGIVTKDDLNNQYQEFLLNKEANPPQKPWESEKLAPMLPPEPKQAPANEEKKH
jgi:hypothetical protein